MADGRGGFVVVSIIGLIVISAATGAYLTSSLSPSTPYPTYVLAEREVTVKSGERFTTKRPCESMLGHDDADLCAQWRAASAAEHAAIWNFAQMILSAAGLLGLLITLWYNRTALQIAAGSQQDARKVGRAQVRSYLNVSSPRIFISEHGIMGVSLKIKNVGQSPATKVAVKTIVKVGGLVLIIKKFTRALSHANFQSSCLATEFE